MEGKIFVGKRDRYAISTLSGEGGVGSVYKAKGITSGQVVAVKLLHSKRFSSTDVQRERFNSEISACLNVNSEFIVKGIDEGIYDSEPFLVLEWMSGGTIQEYIANGNYGLNDVISLTTQLLKAYRDLRKQGLVHRDIKPNNVLMSSEGRLKLADLGIAKNTSIPAYLTMTDQKMGSLLYISERQRYSPETASTRDDFYSICLVLYELISRRRIHTKNLPLSFLRPSLAPVALSILVDKGKEDTEEWEEIFSEMCQYLDLDKEKINENYTGSPFIPEIMLQFRVKETIAQLEKKFFPEDSECHSDGNLIFSNEMISKASSIVANGFNDCVREFQGVGIHLWIAPEIEQSDDENYYQTFWASFSDSLAEVLEESNILENVQDRLYGWISFQQIDENSFHIENVDGKRLYADTDYLPEDVFERKFHKLGESEISFLREIGRTLAIGAAIGALDRIQDFIDEDMEN